jgi:hypothetical protein
MMDSPITYRPLRPSLYQVVFLFIIAQIVALVQWIFYDYSELDILLVFVFFALIPVLLSISGFFLSWRLKRDNLTYTATEWNFSPVQLRIQEAKKLPSQYRKKYSRIVAVPYLWYYYCPIAIIIVLFTLPIYASQFDPVLLSLIPLAYYVLLNVLLLISVWGGWRSTSTAASEQFRLPLIREAVKLAETQEKVSGISHVRVVLDKATSGDCEIYRDPRVVIRVQGLEQDCYIESWAEEFGSVSRVQVRIMQSNGFPEIAWWWYGEDRYFRKYVGESDESYYVRNPVHSRVSELGVKDVQLVTENAVGILILQWTTLRGKDESLSQILASLDVRQS